MPGACITPIINAATLPCESQNSQHVCFQSLLTSSHQMHWITQKISGNVPRNITNEHFALTMCVQWVCLCVCMCTCLSVCLSVCLSSRCPSEFVSVICGSACVCVSVFIPVHACERLITRLLSSAFVAWQVSTAAPGVRKHITIILHIISEIVTDRQTDSHCHRRHTDTERLMHTHTKMWQPVISLKQYDRHKNWHDDAEYFS